MLKAVLGLATDKGVSVIKPGNEVNAFSLAGQGLLDRHCTCIQRTGEGHIAVGTSTYFVQLSKDGFEWKTQLEGLSRPHITTLARHPKHPSLLFAGTSAPAVFMSADFGKTWKQLGALENLESAKHWSFPTEPYKARISSLAVHDHHAGVVFAAIENGGLAASKDGGKTWFDRGKGLPTSVRSIIFPSGLPNSIYAGTGAGFFRSENFGATWEPHMKGVPFERVEAMISAASNANIVLASVVNEVSKASTIVLSKDGGKSWDAAVEGLPRLDDRRTTCFAFGKGGFYAGTDQGDLFCLDNMDGRWTRIAARMAPIRGIQVLS